MGYTRASGTSNVPVCVWDYCGTGETERPTKTLVEGLGGTWYHCGLKHRCILAVDTCVLLIRDGVVLVDDIVEIVNRQTTVAWFLTCYACSAIFEFHSWFLHALSWC